MKKLKETEKNFANYTCYQNVKEKLLMSKFFCLSVWLCMSHDNCHKKFHLALYLTDILVRCDAFI